MYGGELNMEMDILLTHVTVIWRTGFASLWLATCCEYASADLAYGLCHFVVGGNKPCVASV
jgi:hypothetical protein